MLQKFFLSQVKLAIPETVAEALAGHIGYLDDAYLLYTRTHLAELYKKAEINLLIGLPRGSAEIAKKVAETSDTLMTLMRENLFLRQRVGELEAKAKKLEEVSKELEELRKMVENMLGE